MVGWVIRLFCCCGEGLDPWVLGLLGLVCIAIASPDPDDLQQEGEVDPIALAACIVAFGFAVTQQYATQGLPLPVVCCCFIARECAIGRLGLCWLMGSMTVVLVCVAGGGTTLAGLGLLEAEGMIGEWILMPMSGRCAPQRFVGGGGRFFVDVVDTGSQPRSGCAKPPDFSGCWVGGRRLGPSGGVGSVAGGILAMASSSRGGIGAVFLGVNVVPFEH